MPKSPEPTQVSFDSLLDQVHAVRVFKGGCNDDMLFANDLLLEVSALTIVDGLGGHCMCYGGPTLEMLSADRVRLALLSIHHGQAIRWKQWKSDARLADGRSLLEWLAVRGVFEPLHDFQAAETQQRQRRDAWNRWVESMPVFLKGVPEVTWQECTRNHDLTAVLAAAKACQDTRERILALFEWYGSGVGPWAGYPAWEQLLEQLLLTFSQADLVHAAAAGPLTEARLEGAARFFSGTAFQDRSKKRDTEEPLSIWYSDFDVFQGAGSGEPAGVPEALMWRLWDHCQKSNDPDKRQRGESAFRVQRD